jgi:hypothetical protein
LAVKRLIIGLVALLLVALGVVILWPKGPKESIGHTISFSDGTKMTLKDVTYGTENHYLGGWKARLISGLPKTWRGKFRVGQGTFNTIQPSIVFWLAREGNGPTTGDPKLILCDRSGYGVSGGHSMMRMGAPGNWVEGWAFSYFPRRQRSFTLRIYEQGARYPDAKLVGEFTIRNPKPGKYPTWSAPAPPITAREGDMAVTLVDLMSDVGRGSNKWKPAPNPTVSMTRAGFRVERNGAPTREWEVTSVESTDATGNVIKDLWGTASDGGLEYVQLQPHPWPDELAWKLRVGFTQRSNFVASELWTLRNVALAGVAGTNRPAVETNLQGAVVTYTGEVAQRGAAYEFEFGIKPPRPNYRMTLVKAVDDKGGEAKEVGSFESWNEWRFSLEVNTNATSVDLTVALHETRYFDFLVRPQIISTNREVK